MNRLGAAFMVLIPVISAFAEPTVTDVVAKQRYPWNGLVDITCKVTGISGIANDLYFSASAVMPNNGGVHKIPRFWVLQGGTNSTDRNVYTNGSYHLIWDAQSDLGQVTYSNMIIRVVIKPRNKVQLWAGGPYWATVNIGADDPEDYGCRFFWGDTIGYKLENEKWVAIDGSSSNFSFDESNTPTYNKSIATLKSQGWLTAGNVLVPEHDAAHVHWGGNWRLPTKQELSDLVDKCDWTATRESGYGGYIIKGKGSYSSASVFLPSAGHGYGTSCIDAGVWGEYWSSVPYSDDDVAWDLCGQYLRTPSRYFGLPIRPVQ